MIRDPGPPYATLRARTQPCPDRASYPTRESAARHGPDRRIYLCPICHRFHIGKADPVRLQPKRGPAMGGPSLAHLFG